MTTTSATFTLGGPADAGSTRLLTPARDGTNGAPCLGLAVLAAGTLWAGLGSALALLLA